MTWPFGEGAQPMLRIAWKDLLDLPYHALVDFLALLSGIRCWVCVESVSSKLRYDMQE
jgi:hypothetical protein